jgi:hypothetical protein
LVNDNSLDGDSVVIPVWQPFIKCEDRFEEMVEIQKELFEFARKGELLIDYDTFKDSII